MTINKTIDEINIELGKAKNKDINIQIDPNKVACVHFLDITTTNDNGQLRTSIYHTPPYCAHLILVHMSMASL